MPPSYITLINRLKAGDMAAFDEIYDLTKKAVYYAAYAVFNSREIAEDVMHDVYLNLLEKKDRLKEDVDLPAYLFQSAKHRAYDLYMKRKREEGLVEGVGDDRVYDPGPDSGLLGRIAKILTPREYDVFTLRVLGEYSFKEISKMRGIKTGTLTWLYQEARKKLEREMKER